jgi:stage V sporulation protein B
MKGVAVLGAAGFVVKFVGAFFRIPLANIIDTDGLGLYQMAYPIYAFLLVASTAGLPVAISKMVAAELAHGEKRKAHQIFKVALRLLTAVGIVTFILMACFSRFIAININGNVKSVYSLLAISPALFFVSIMSAFRGYFQGMRIMMPTAVSQIVEQCGKLIIGLSLASILIPYGPEYGAAGAMLGVTLSEIAALVFLLGVYQRNKKEIWADVRDSTIRNNTANQTVLKALIRIAVPITIGASLMPLVNLIDLVIVVNRLKPIIDQISNIPHNAENFALFLQKSGISNVSGTTMQSLIAAFPDMYRSYVDAMATSLYGIAGACYTLINFPAVFSLAIGMSLVPAISEAVALNKKHTLARTAGMGIKTTLLVGLPSSIGIILLAKPIASVLYGSWGTWKIEYAAWLLGTLGIAVVFLTLVQSLTAILQGIGHVKVPVRNLFLGAIVKVVVTYVCVGMPAWNVKGAALGTVLCYATAALLDLVAVIKYTGVVFSFRDFIIRPVIAASAMGAIVWFVYHSQFSNSEAAMLGISILIGVIAYAIMLIVTGALTKDDLSMVPKGEKITKFLMKWHLIK